MGYLSKESVLKAFENLSKADNSQGYSAMQYFLGLDRYCKEHTTIECDLNDKTSKEEFKKYVINVVQLENNQCYLSSFATLYTKKEKSIESTISSNFFNGSAPARSKKAPGISFFYPEKNALLGVKDYKLLCDNELYANISVYLKTEEDRFSLAVWLLRNVEGVVETSIAHLRKKLSLYYRDALVDSLIPTTMDQSFVDKFIDISDSYNQVEEPDIKLILGYNAKDNAEEKKPNIGMKKSPLQQIFYGAPGTGKSHTIDEDTNESNRIRTTFHPDYDYATFVGCYKPTMEEAEVRVVPVVLDNGTSFSQNNGTYKENKIVYKFVPQSFTKAYVEAWRRFANPECTDKNYYLVIEEINRGNCAQIFGDLFQLLDRTRGGYSSYAVEADTDLQKFLATDNEWKLNITLTEDIKNDEGRIIAKAEDVMSGKVLVLPPNLHIWATMNTSDQSLFPIDSAFKRRWDWTYVPIKYEKTAWRVVLSDKCWCSWTELQTTLNDLIYDATESEDKMLGDWFVKADDKDVITEEQLVGKIIFYLWNDVAKVDAGKLFDLEVVEKRGKNKRVTFSDFYEMSRKTNTAIVKEWLTKIGISINKPEVDPETTVGTDTSASVPTKPEYQRLFDVLKAKCEANGIKYKSFSNSINMAIGEYAFSKLMIAVALDSTGTPSADIKLWIEGTPKAIATRNTLRSNGAGAFFEELAQESDKLSWEEIAKDVPETESKVRGWRLHTTAITFDEANVAEEAEWIFAKVQQIRKRFANVL